MSRDWSSVPKAQMEVAKYLRSKKSGMKEREGICNGKRIHYFKGKSAVNALLRLTYKSASRPVVKGRDDAEKLVTKLLESGLFLLTSREERSKVFQIVPEQKLDLEGHYVWVYEGSMLKTYLIGSLVVLITLAGVMFPMWPYELRIGVWYLSMAALGLLGVFFALAVIRLIVWVFCIMFMGKGGWLYPNLFADVGIIESFQPSWEWESKKSKKRLDVGSEGDSAESAKED